MWVGSSLAAATEIGLFVLAVVAGLILLEPLFGRRRAWLFRPRDPLFRLAQEREQVLRAIKDLEFEHQTGKIDGADLAPLREPLYARAAALTGELDRLRAEDDRLRAEVERELAEAVRKP